MAGFRYSRCKYPRACTFLALRRLAQDETEQRRFYAEPSNFTEFREAQGAFRDIRPFLIGFTASWTH